MRAPIALIAIAAALLAGARGARAVTIADLVADPDAYDRQTVTVTGEVEQALPVGAESGYNLRDGAARVTVISRSAPPAVGTNLAVTATVRALRNGGDDDPETTHFPPLLIESGRAPAP